MTYQGIGPVGRVSHKPDQVADIAAAAPDQVVHALWWLEDPVDVYAGGNETDQSIHSRREFPARAIRHLNGRDDDRLLCPGSAQIKGGEKAAWERVDDVRSRRFEVVALALEKELGNAHARGVFRLP